MSSPYVGECRLVGFNFAPVGWLMCQGQLVPISQNETLYNLIGTTYGGDGQSTFGIPDLRGRVPIHQGGTYVIGQNGGQENVTLNTQEIPSHTHTLIGSTSNGNSNLAQGAVLAACPTSVYKKTNVHVGAAMNQNAITSVGGNQAHNNLQPFLTMTWIISLYGVYPSQ